MNARPELVSLLVILFVLFGLAVPIIAERLIDASVTSSGTAGVRAVVTDVAF